jgi:anti-sigma B factor antagonist
MKLSEKKLENLILVSIEGEIDAVTGSELADFFNEQLPKTSNLIADFAKVEFISSAGLRVLLGTVKDMRKIGGDLRLANVSEKIFKVFKITGFTKFIKFYPDLEAAIESFSE